VNPAAPQCANKKANSWGWSSVRTASIHSLYRVRAGSMAVMQDEQGGKPIKDLGDANLIGEDEIGPHG
jgi:hypothetical protein